MQPISQNHSVERPADPRSEPSTLGWTIIALGIIAGVGVFVACIFIGLYTPMGKTVVALTPIGLVVPIMSIYISACVDRKGTTANEHHHTKLEKGNDLYQYRAQVFIETRNACKDGYSCNGSSVPIDNAPIVKGTCTFKEIPEIKVNRQHQTAFSVDIDDTINVLLQLRKKGVCPAGINMANRYHAGGGVDRGSPAQEEALCRRTNLILGLETQTYPIPEEGCIYSPHVQVFRDDEPSKFTFMPAPEEVAFVSVPAFDLRGGSSDRASLGLPAQGDLSQDLLEKNQQFVDKTKNKIRNTLRAMYNNGHTHIVLGALGCGAFQTPPQSDRQTIPGSLQRARV